MPTYDYICSTCGYEFEHFQSMSEEPIRTCPSCDGRVRRKIGGGTGLIFKGSGYYLTDYVKKSNLSQKETIKKSENNKNTKVKNGKV